MQEFAEAGDVARPGQRPAAGRCSGLQRLRRPFQVLRLKAALLRFQNWEGAQNALEQGRRRGCGQAGTAGWRCGGSSGGDRLATPLQASGRFLPSLTGQ